MFYFWFIHLYNKEKGEKYEIETIEYHNDLNWIDHVYLVSVTSCDERFDQYWQYCGDACFWNYHGLWGIFGENQ